MPAWNSPETPQAKQGIVGHGLNLVPLQVNVCQVLHSSDGPWDSPEVVLETQQLLHCYLLNKDAVWDAEEITVRQIQPQQLFQPCERPCVKVADVLVVGHFQLQQVREALQDQRLDHVYV